ncbi:MAG: 4Fe-4S binding protein [Desulfovibrionaceae bacterium]|nr:4Fe-4S binding protein [Desulfovibrionaceae bacterium]
MKQKKKKYNVRINKQCIGCGECVDICPAHVLIMNQKRAYIDTLSRCIGCSVCETTCPVDAITVRTI